MNLTNILQALLSPAWVGYGDTRFVEGPAIFVIPATVALVLVFLGSFLWLYRDARARGKNPWLAIVFVALTGWPLAFIWWLWLRPPLLEPVGQRVPLVPAS